MRNEPVVSNDSVYRLYCAVALLTLATFAVIFTISPINGEDFAFTSKFTAESFGYRFAFIFGKSANQIQNWNARLGEQLAIFWMSWPRLYFTLAALAAFTALCYLLAVIVSDGTERLEKTAVSIAAIFSLWPGMELFFWSTAHAGYLQPLLLFLMCIFFYRNEQAVSRLNQSLGLVCLVSIAAFFGGLSFETVPIAVLVYLALTLFFCKGKSITWRTVAPLLAMAAGWVVLVTAPSTFIRRAYYAKVYQTDGYSIEYLMARTADVLEVFQRTTTPLFTAYVIATVYLVRRKELRKPLFFLFITGMLTVFSISAAPYTEPRAFGLAWALMYAVVLAGLFNLMTKHGVVRLLLVPVLIGLLYFPFKTYSLYSQFAGEMNARDAIIRSEIAVGNCKQGVTVKQNTTSYEYKYLLNRDDWFKSSTNWVGIYYNCKIIVE